MSVTPTGKRRLRLHFDKGWFCSRWKKPILVLQIEVSGYESQYVCGYIDHIPVRFWRDARIEDMPTGDVNNWEDDNGTAS